MQVIAQPIEQKLKLLNVITLNYSGILDSPYQFYSNELEKEEKEISQICHELIKLKKGFSEKDFKWKMGKIDQKCQKSRYSPLYHRHVGTEGGKLLNKQEFEAKWEANFKPEKNQFTPSEIGEAKEFDFLIYSTLVAYSNQVKDLTSISFKDLSAQRYLQLQSLFFSKSFLDEEKKIQKTINLLKRNKADVIFLQEANQNIRKALILTGQFYLISKQGSDSIILMKVKTFNQLGKPQIKVDLKYHEMSNWNSDTLWCIIGNIVFVSAHLSSKTEKNQQQVVRLWKDLHQIRKREPELHVIIGIDANVFLELEKNSKDQYYIFPSNPNHVTTNKKRTWLQPQVNKADKIARTSRDHILSDLPLSNTLVTLMNGLDEQVWIPTQSHPYDHYIVSAQISVPY